MMGEEVPDPIKNAPELRQDLFMYLEAFYELDSERSDGLIPWTSIIRYGEYHEFDDEQMDNLLCYVRKLDQVITTHRNEKLKLTAKGGPKTLNNRNGSKDAT